MTEISWKVKFSDGINRVFLYFILHLGMFRMLNLVV